MNTLLSLDLFEQIPGEIAWKNTKLYYIGCNLSRARAANFKYPEEMIGLTDMDLTDQSSESISFHRRHDEMALNGKIIKTIHPSAVKNDSISYFQIKKPLYVDGKISGVIYHCHEFMNYEFFQHMQKMDKRHFPEFVISSFYQIDPETNFYQFTTRELECLFCILRGMSAKRIGDLLGISKRTVEFYIDNMKNKVGCGTKRELIVMAIEAGYIQLVPARFLEMDWKE